MYVTSPGVKGFYDWTRLSKGLSAREFTIKLDGIGNDSSLPPSPRSTLLYLTDNPRDLSALKYACEKYRHTLVPLWAGDKRLRVNPVLSTKALNTPLKEMEAEIERRLEQANKRGREQMIKQYPHLRKLITSQDSH